MNLTDVNLVSFSGGYFTLRNEHNHTLEVARIDEVTVETLPSFGGLCLAVYRLWTASTYGLDLRPNCWEPPTEGRASIPKAIALKHHHFFERGAKGRLIFAGKENGDVGTLALPHDPLFDEAVVPKQYRSR